MRITYFKKIFKEIKKLERKIRKNIKEGQEVLFDDGSVSIKITADGAWYQYVEDEKLRRRLQSILSKLISSIEKEGKQSSVSTEEIAREDDTSSSSQNNASGSGSPTKANPGCQSETRLSNGADASGIQQDDFSGSGKEPGKSCGGFNDHQGDDPSMSEQSDMEKVYTGFQQSGAEVGEQYRLAKSQSAMETAPGSEVVTSWEEEEPGHFIDLTGENRESAHLGGGGGEQINSELYRYQKDLRLLKTLSGCFSSRQPFGIDKFEKGRKIYKKEFVKGLITPHKLLNCFRNTARGNIYLIMDTSGSVSHFSNLILQVINTAKLPANVNIWSGSEAHPNKNEKNGKSVKYIHSFFEDLKRFIKKETPPLGSIFIFWGDLHDVNIRGEEAKIKKLLLPYRAFWLHCCDDTCNYKGCEKKEARMAGFKIFKKISSVEKFNRALKTIVGG